VVLFDDRFVPDLMGRLGGLTELDPKTAPLPVGTRVTARVDRQVGDRVVTAGAVGRVVAVDGDTVTVALVRGGQARYARDELAPRQPGLVRFEARRDQAWAALSPTIVLEVVVGSRAWGVADTGSDEDRRGVFVAPLPWVSGLVDAPEDLLSADRTTAAWEVGKAVRQALRADPNTLEMLFLADVAAVRDPMGAWLVAARSAFVSQAIYDSFGRYALSQLDRLEHNQRLAEHREHVMRWLAADPALSLDAVAERLAQVASVRGDLVRLLDLATRWLAATVDEPPPLAAPAALVPTLRAIKAEQVPMVEVMALARELTAGLEAARQTTRLPRRADPARAEEVLRAIRREAAQRAIADAPGPWGRDHVPPPPARFAEEDSP
jgi:hypothetical protein